MLRSEGKPGTPIDGSSRRFTPRHSWTPTRHGLRMKFMLLKDFFDQRNPLYGLTPDEAEQNIQLDRVRLSNYIKQAIKELKTYNQLHRCSVYGALVARAGENY